jgi:dihydroxyacetone kinase-like predicted kinase
MEAGEREIITLYYGDTVSEGDAKRLAGHLEQEWAELEIEVVPGEQPHYHYILSVE